MLDVQYIIQWYKWLLQFLRSKNNGSLPYQSEKKEPIHVLMNGPSLMTTVEYMKRISGKVMMVNNALSNPHLFYPDYYCIVDPVYANLNFDLTKDLYKAFEEYQRPLVVFTTKTISNKMNLENSNIRVQDVCCNVCPEYKGKKEKFILQKNYASFLPQGVVVTALYISIQMGYKEIYLHGADANEILGMHVDEKNRVTFKRNHYYDDGSEEIWHEGHNMLKEYKANLNLYEALYGLEKYSLDCGAKIINMSNNSYIDCFEKVGYTPI